MRRTLRRLLVHARRFAQHRRNHLGAPIVGRRHQLPAPPVPPARCARRPCRFVAARFARNSSSVTCSGSEAFGLSRICTGIVLAQRMAFPVVRHQQPAQVAMTLEHDAEQVPDFALEPAGARPDALHASAGAADPRQRHLQPEASVRRRQVIHHFEPRLARPPVHRRDVGQQDERQLGPSRSTRHTSRAAARPAPSAIGCWPSARCRVRARSAAETATRSASIMRAGSRSSSAVGRCRRSATRAAAGSPGT